MKLTRLLNDRNIPWSLLLLVILGFIGTLFVPHMNEEHNYTIPSLNMLLNDSWFSPQILEKTYPRPPLYNWMIVLPLKIAIPATYVLYVARVLAFGATVLTALGIFILSETIWQQRQLSWISVFCFLTGDILFRRAWIAYPDPLVTLFLFISFASLLLYVRCEKPQTRYIFASSFFVFLAYLCKIHISYLFYLTFIASICMFREYRQKIATFKFLVSQLLLIIVPFLLWQYSFEQNINNSSNFVWGVGQIYLEKLRSQGLFKSLMFPIIFPLNVFLLLLPASLVGLYAFMSKKTNKFVFMEDDYLKLFALTFLFSLIPYWLATRPLAPRYIMPIMPFAALVLGNIIYKAGNKSQKLFWVLTAIVVVIKLLTIPLVYKKEETFWGSNNVVKVAEEIDLLATQQSVPIYFKSEHTTPLLRIAANLNILRFPKVVLPFTDDDNYLLLSLKENSGPVVLKIYEFSRNSDVYLSCKGRGCK